MEKKEVKVVFRKRALEDIRDTAFFIEENGYPETAERFAEKLFEFGQAIATFPLKYPVCRFSIFAKRHLRCATFDHTYIFVYKTVKDKLIIYNVIHSKRLK